MLRHGSLFSGIGGFDLAAEWVGWENVFHCEWNDFGQKVLKHYWPDAESFGDITKTDFTKFNGTVDIISGGFPCQPYSSAGKRLGKEDERHLWPEMLRVIREVKPCYVVGENVFGLLNWDGGLVFDEVHADLAAEGYEAQAVVIPAAAVNAPHGRDRVWFVAKNASGDGCLQRELRQERAEVWEQRDASPGGSNGVYLQEGNATDTKRIRLEYGTTSRQVPKKNENAKRQRSKSSLFTPTNDNGHQSNWHNFPTQPPICGGDDGLPSKLDGITFSKWRAESIKGYGNAIVPQVAYQIFKTIDFLDQNK